MQVAAEEDLAPAYDRRLLRWIWKFVHPYRKLFWLSVLLMPLNALFLLAQPYIVKITFDLFFARRLHAPPALLVPLIGNTVARGLLVMGLIYLVLVVGEFVTYYGQFYLTMMVAQYSLSDLRLSLFRHIESLPMAFFDRTPVGRLVSRMTGDIDAINEMFGAGSLTIFIDLLTLAGIIVIMLTLSFHLALWTLCSVPPLFLIVNFIRVRARVVYRQQRERAAALNSYLSEAIGGMVAIQLFTREDESRGEFKDLNRKSRDSQMMGNVYESGLFSSVEVVSSITLGVILLVGGSQAIHHVISLGTLAAFFEYTRQFFNPLREMSTKYTTLQAALASAERVEALMEEPRTVASPAAPRAVAKHRGEIVFEQVNFAYRPGEPVLKDVSFRVEPGQKIAIVGATGSGKTTIIKLLNRFYDVSAGRILVDDLDVRDWDLSALRREIGLVQQDVSLFTGDVLENVRLARTDLPEAEVRTALDRAQALSFVDRLPQQLREPINERGANLSAGQRQLLSFARALVYDPRILVMDEATSSVDSQTERLIQLALDELLQGRTALIIAHRLSTIEKADRIMVMSHGVLRESGTHDELLASRGLYFRLFELQYASGESLQSQAAAD
jgi:ATP-binding cassette subfamily B multidrug efflux pump